MDDKHAKPSISVICILLRWGRSEFICNIIGFISIIYDSNDNTLNAVHAPGDMILKQFLISFLSILWNWCFRKCIYRCPLNYHYFKYYSVTLTAWLKPLFCFHLANNFLPLPLEENKLLPMGNFYVDSVAGAKLFRDGKQKLNCFRKGSESLETITTKQREMVYRSKGEHEIHGQWARQNGTE